MQLGVSEVSKQLGVSERRVRAMLEAGILEGEKLGGRWVVSLSHANLAERAPVRPLSARSCLVLIDGFEPGLSRGLSAVEKHRLKVRLNKLGAASDPLPLLRAWLVHRAQPRRLRASPGDLDDLRADHRLALSGVSHQDSGLLAGNEVEAYVAGADARDIVDDYLLVPPRPDSPANVVLHVLEEHDRLPWPQVPPLALAADLAERQGARENDAARELVRRALADHPA